MKTWTPAQYEAKRANDYTCAYGGYTDRGGCGLHFCVLLLKIFGAACSALHTACRLLHPILFAVGTVSLGYSYTLLQRGTTLRGDADARAATEARSVILDAERDQSGKGARDRPRNEASP
eukprot:scaffold56169_cov81-Phaeocystis_antarctica.AAC.3